MEAIQIKNKVESSYLMDFLKSELDCKQPRPQRKIIATHRTSNHRLAIEIGW